MTIGTGTDSVICDHGRLCKGISQTAKCNPLCEKCYCSESCKGKKPQEENPHIRAECGGVGVRVGVGVGGVGGVHCVVVSR